LGICFTIAQSTGVKEKVPEAPSTRWDWLETVLVALVESDWLLDA